MATQNRTDGRPQPVAIGIDLGTSKCCVAAVRDGRVHVLENEFGQRTTPSWVAFNSQQRLVGGAALDQAVVNCANTVSAVKRTLGRTYDHVKGLPSSCKINSCSYSFQYCVSYKNRLKNLAPEQITAMMLTKMKDIAETSLGCAVNRAVISVPASYGNAQRVALKTAAKVAGIEVLQLINETTAAGIAFADNRTATTPATIAVVDFGAGKLDVSVMKVEEKSVKVIAAAGNSNLGGCNIDGFLSDHCAAVIEKDCKITLTTNEKAMLRLRLACEKVKKTLSLLPETRLVIDSLIGDTNVDIPVHRKDLNVLIKSDIHREIVEICDCILLENNIGMDAIDKVVLVGGSTRIPVVKSILEEYFGSHKLDQTVNQDEAVAQGAALRAAALSGAAAAIQVVDVASFDIYSTQIVKDGESIIRSNTRVPYSVDLLLSIPYWGSIVSFFEKNNSCSSKINNLLGKQYFSRGLSRNIPISLTIDGSGIFDIFVEFRYRSYFDKRRMSSFYHDDHIRDWISAEKQFRQDIRDELARVEAEVTLESLIFEVQSALKDPEIKKYSPSNLKFLQSKCSTAQSCVDDISSVPEYKIKEQIKTMREAKTEVERWKIAAHKKAADEKAAKERAELEQEVTQKNYELKSLHSELQKTLKQPELVHYSPALEIRWCEEALGRIDSSQKFASLKEVSEKIELLNGVKSRLEKLEESSRRKALKEKEEAIEKKQHLKEEISSGFSMIESLRGKLISFEHTQKEAEDSQLTDNLQQKIVSFEETLNGILKWVTNTDTTSLSEILKKIEEVNEIKADVVVFELKLRSAEMKKSELSESSTKKLNNVLEIPFSENDGLIDQIDNSDQCVSHLQSREMQAKSTNSSAGHTSRSREKPRRNSPSRSRSTERKEKVDSDRSRSPLPKGIETGYHTPPFGSSSNTERNQVSSVLSPGTRVESNHADGGYRPLRETCTDASKLIPLCRGEKEHRQPASIVNTRAVLNHADGGCRPFLETTTDASKLCSSCVKEEHQPFASLDNSRAVLGHEGERCRPSQETTADTTKLYSSCGKVKEHPPASLVSDEAEGKNSAAVRNSSASASMPNGADYCSETTSVSVSGQSSLVSIPGMENYIDSDSDNATDSNTVLGSQRTSPKKVSSVRNDVVSNSTPTILGSPNGAGERESETAPAQSEKEASNSSNGPNDLQENVAKTSNMFYQYPGLQEWIEREVNKCETCRGLRYVCYKTRILLENPWNEFITNTGTQILKSAANGCNGEAPQYLTPKPQISVSEALEQVKKSSNRNTERH